MVVAGEMSWAETNEPPSIRCTVSILKLQSLSIVLLYFDILLTDHCVCYINLDRCVHSLRHHLLRHRAVFPLITCKIVNRPNYRA